jgi:hypothetical protein
MAVSTFKEKMSGIGYIFIRFCLIIFCLYISAYIFDIWRGSPHIDFDDIPNHNYLPDIMRLNKEKRIPEALAIYNYIKRNPSMPSHRIIVNVGEEILRENNRLIAKAERFSSGFLWGEKISEEALIGTIISDFLFVGDIRDLTREGYKALNGEDVDELLVLLSNVSLVNSATLFFPEFTSKVAASCIQTTLSIFKALSKANALSPKLTKTILSLLKTNNWKQFSKLLRESYELFKAAPPGSIVPLMKYIDSNEDLIVIKKWVEMKPDETIVALAMGNKKALTWMKHKGDPSKSEVRIELIRVLKKGSIIFLKQKKRIFKKAYKSTLEKISTNMKVFFSNHQILRYILPFLILIGIIFSICYFFSIKNKLKEIFS